MKKFLNLISNIKYGEIEITTPEKKNINFLEIQKNQRQKLKLNLINQ